MEIRRVSFVVGFALLLAASGSGFAQTQFKGRIDVAVTDSTGGVLPGATVELTGQEIHAAATDARGEAHFLNLEPGTYQVKIALSGFQDYVNPNEIGRAH